MSKPTRPPPSPYKKTLGRLPKEILTTEVMHHLSCQELAAFSLSSRANRDAAAPWLEKRQCSIPKLARVLLRAVKDGAHVSVTTENQGPLEYEFQYSSVYSRKNLSQVRFSLRRLFVHYLPPEQLGGNQLDERGCHSAWSCGCKVGSPF